MRTYTKLEQEQQALKKEIRDAIYAASQGATNLATKALVVFEAAGTSDELSESPVRFAEYVESLAYSLKQHAEYIKEQAGYVAQVIAEQN